MRLFVGVEFDAQAAQALESVADDMRRLVRDIAPEARLSWIPAERLHLTLRFLGEVGDAMLAALKAAFEPPLSVAPFHLRLVDTGVFPVPGRPRVLWVGVDGGESLARLGRHVSDRLASCGLPGESRELAPHVTLARVRDASGLSGRGLAGALPRGLFATTRVDATTLFRSVPASTGPTYLPLRRTPLVGSA